MSSQFTSQQRHIDTRFRSLVEVFPIIVHNRRIRWFPKGWIVIDGSWRRPRGDDWKRRSPFAVGEDDVCALLRQREGPSCAAKDEGRGSGESLAATTTDVGGTMGGATRWPVLVARPALSHKIFHPHVSLSLPPLHFALSHFYLSQISRCSYFVSVCRASCSNSRWIERSATNIKSADEGSRSLRFRVRHFASIPLRNWGVCSFPV
jgi:hypothetical protein